MTRRALTSAAPARRTVSQAVALVLIAVGVLFAAEPTTVTRFGDPVAVGDGFARTYVVTDPAGKVVEVGVALEEDALRKLPDGSGHHGTVGPDGHVSYEHVLTLPEDNPTPFQHVVVNWNPGGHEPPGIYHLQHFDFHFYTMSVAERGTIDPADPAFQQRAEHVPAPEFVPAGYILPEPLAFPRMGVHWVDPTSPELNGETFTHTFIIGSWDGRVHFWEPMITKAFLESKATAERPVPHPLKAYRAGQYPGGYRVRWDAEMREWKIALVDFAAVEGR